MLAAIAASPADDQPRRVLADYWIDHGDADRGMFVQVSCERLDAHVHAMLAEHGLHWFEPLWRAGFLHDRVEIDRWGAPADVWSLAMVLVELALGRSQLRRDGDTDFATLQAINEMAFDVPATPLGQVLARALVREPERRPLAFDLARQLEALA